MQNLTENCLELEFIDMTINSNVNPSDKDYYVFLNGLKLKREKNQTTGMLLEKHNDKLPIHLKPILQNDSIIVRQDTKYPVPAFYIISIKEPIGSIADISIETAMLLGGVTKIIREAMREVLGVERVNIYIEEKSRNGHYHKWILPMWGDVLSNKKMNPRIWQDEIMEYIGSFSFEQQDKKILRCNELMEKHLSKIILNKDSILFKNNFKV